MRPGVGEDVTYPWDDEHSRGLGELETWGEPLPPEPAPPGGVAWYVTKWRRRLPKVVIALSLLILVGGIVGLSTLGNLDVGLPSTEYLWVPVAVLVAFVLVSSLILTTMVAFVWGRQVSARQRRRSARIGWSVATALLLIVAVVGTWFVRPPGAAAPRTVASEQEGCQVYLDVIEESAQEGASAPGLDRYLRPLEAAAAGEAPELAADLQHYFEDETWRGYDTTTQAVVDRCSRAGWLSMQDMVDHQERMTQILAGR